MLGVGGLAAGKGSVTAGCGGVGQGVEVVSAAECIAVATTG